ncbi:MAG: 30S ribosomal protein S2 [Bacteroidota bacterium]
MQNLTHDELLDAGVHFGHLKSKWNPKMAPYILMEKSGIHLIDLNKTIVKLDEAANAIRQIARSGKKILFVATKKQAKDIVTLEAKRVGMPYITERWPGGMLTNFTTVRKSVKKMAGFEKMETDGTFANISKKEKLQITRQKIKMEKLLGSISDLSRLPAALFIVDISREHIAVKEAQKLNIPTFAIVDTNSDPSLVDFPIPGNDDAAKSISLIVSLMANAIEDGINDRKNDRDIEKATEGTEDGSGVKVINTVEVEDDETTPTATVTAGKATGKVLRPRRAGAPGKKGE